MDRLSQDYVEAQKARHAGTQDCLQSAHTRYLTSEKFQPPTKVVAYAIVAILDNRDNRTHRTTYTPRKMQLLDMLVVLFLSIITGYANLINQVTSPQQAINLTLPSSSLSSLPPIRPSLNLTTARIQGWNSLQSATFIYFRSFPDQKLPNPGFFMIALARAIEKDSETPLPNGRFELQSVGIYFQVLANEQSPYWEDLNYGVLQDIFDALLHPLFGRQRNVLYADIMSVERTANGHPPIGRMVLDNQPPEGWKGDSEQQ